MIYSNDPLIKQIQERLYKYNKNWLCLIVGETGSGKSYSAMSLADMIDPNFTIENVIPNPLDFANGVIEHKFKKGSVVVLDEIGVSMNSRRSSSDFNVALSNIFQTFRRWNIGVIYTVPSGMMVDKNVRRLIHHYIVINGVIPDTQLCSAKIYKVNYNALLDRTFLELPRLEHTNGIPSIVNEIFIPAPREELQKKYEELDREYKQSVAEKSRDMIKAMLSKETVIQNKWIAKNEIG